MASTAPVPQILPTGMTAPSFQDYWNYFTTQLQGIYGADFYLDPDSADGQFIAVFAQACADCASALVATFNSFSPAKAQGAGLSSVVKINGLKRKIPSFSTVLLTLVGVANTQISNGQASDGTNIWALPALVTIPGSGTIDVVATCTTAGAITAAEGTITIKQTPTYGWQTVTNANAAAVGAPVEDDAQLRVRQSQSTSLPAQTIFESIVAAIANTSGVTRVRGIENNTLATNGYGVPAKSMDFIVEGGAPADIFAAINGKINPGAPTWDAGGTNNNQATVVNAVTGSTRLLNYQTPTDATISVALGIVPLNGWSTATEAVIQEAVTSYLNTLGIGADIQYFGVGAVALLPGTAYYGTYRISSMTIQKNSNTPVTADIQLLYNEAPVSAFSNITFSGV